MDFVLWKPSKQGEPGWPSPCGIAMPGRPGWHIECSAMSWKHLGETFDIHGGGIDLVFPHHENEIAQSRCAFHTGVMANYWMHNGFLQVEGEKMSKSLGNFVTIHELLDSSLGGAIRFAMLQTHYTQPINWTAERLVEAKEEISNWVELISHTAFEQVRKDYDKGSIVPDAGVVEALSDDLNTPAAIGRLRELYSKTKKDRAVAVQLFSSCCFLGLLKPETVGAFRRGAIAGATVLTRYKSIIEQIKTAHANGAVDREASGLSLLKKYGIEVEFKVDGYPILETQDDDVVQKLIEQRAAARKAKDFKESDRIRDELAAMGVVLKDGKDPKTGEPVTTWEVTR
jgi:cysteinyl-tRNA synthetase